MHAMISIRATLMTRHNIKDQSFKVSSFNGRRFYIKYTKNCFFKDEILKIPLREKKAKDFR